MRYHFKIHKEKDGFWAECIELKGCFAQANTMTTLNRNMRRALNTYLQEPQDSKHIASIPKKGLKGKDIVEVAVDPEVAFAFMVRKQRIESRLTQQQAARKLGFSNVYSYQRLEKKCNARLDMIVKLKQLFPSFSLDLIFS